MSRAASILLFVSIILAVPIAGAAPVDEAGLPLWSERVWNDFPVRIELADRGELDDLLAATPVASFSREQVAFTGGRVVFEPRVTEEEAAALIAAGHRLERLPDTERAGRTSVEKTWAERRAAGVAPTKAAPEVLTYYPDYAEVGTFLDQLAADFPTICRTFAWGTSVQGRTLYGLVISADVQNTTAEPEVRLSAAIHGNEPVSMIMLLDLASYLAGNYGKTGFEDVTALVDETEIHIMPLHNPDGYTAGLRNNAAGVDLNRNYPEPAGTHSTTQTENLAFMAYDAAHHFVISQNGHGGALVINYPWDYTPVRAPDDAALIRLSLEYSTYNLPMYNGSFDQGITNGYDWYVATGTLQDWTYHTGGTMDVTAEISSNKWPSANQLDDFWDDNRESLMHFTRAAGYGLRGVVTDSVTGQPLDAVISVAGNDNPVGTDPEHGDWYKLVDDGIYDVAITADGYRTRVFEDVAAAWGTATVLDAALVPDSSSTETPRVRARVAVWPNPFNASTTISFTTTQAGAVRVGVYDLGGRLVRTLVDDDLEADTHSRHWDGADDAGSTVGSGVYLVRMKGGAEEALAKVVLAK